MATSGESEAKISLVVKTLDSMNHPFSDLDPEMTIKDFKAHIEETVNISRELQRLIFTGRVLQDDKKLKDYSLDGKALHLVNRAPPNTNGGPDNVAASEARARNLRPMMMNNGVNIMFHGTPTIVPSNQEVNFSFRRTSSSVRLNFTSNLIRKATAIIDSLDNPDSASPTNEQTPPQNGTGGFMSGGVVGMAFPINSDSVNDSVFQQSISESMNQALGAAGGSSRESLADPLDWVFRNLARIQEENREQPSTTPRTTNSESTASSGTTNSSGTTSSSETTAGSGNATNNLDPPPSVLASVMDEYQTAWTRLTPHWNRLTEILNEDPAPGDNPLEFQNFYGSVTRAMHYLSHALHSMSDISLNFTQQPPRGLRAQPFMVQQTIVEDITGRQRNNGPSNSSHHNHQQRQQRSTTTSSNEGESATTTSRPQPMEVNGMEGQRLVVGIEIQGVHPSNLSSASSSASSGNRTNDSSSGTRSTNLPEGINFINSNGPDFLSNLIRATMTNATSNTRSNNNTGTQPTTSTRTRSSPHVHYAPLGVNGFFSQNVFDPFLDCSSRHTPSHSELNPIRRRTRHPAGLGGSETPRSSSVPPPAPTQTENSDSSLGDNYSLALGVLFNLVANSGAGFIEENANDQWLLNMIQGVLRNVTSAMEPTASTGESTSGDRTFEQFIWSMIELNYVPGEDLLTDLIMTIAPHISFRDIVRCTFGGLRSILPRIREPMRDLFMSYFENNPSRENVQRMVDGWYPQIRRARAVANVDPRVDFEQTFHRFVSEHTQNIIRIIMESEDFSTSINEELQRIPRLFTALGLEVLTDGNSSIERIILDWFSFLFSEGLSPTVRDWITSITTAHLRNYAGSVGTEEIDVSRYIVPAGEETETQGDEASETFRTPRSTPEKMEIDEETSEAAQALPQDTNEFPQELLKFEEDSIPRSSEAWHNFCPAKWIPVVSKDKEKQKNKTEQPPFSYAYLSTLSAKRIKLAEGAKPKKNSGLSEVVSDSLTEALAETRVNLNAEVQAVASDSAVLNAAESRSKSIIKKKLTENDDIKKSEDKFPASKSFMSKK